MKALLAGYGGIGKAVYSPELQKLGYDVDILDLIHPEAKYKDVSEVKEGYDLAVVCTPNHTHEFIARKIAAKGTKRIFVDKPGVSDAASWWNMCHTSNGTKFHLVKNNLYRNNYGETIDIFKNSEVIGVDINWLNDNRIPNPGSWFTTKEKSFGGVSVDLMPHLYCFAIKVFGEKAILDAPFFQGCYRRWDLNNVSTTKYGTVNPNGIYDVDDIAQAAAVINNISLRLTASWKEGYNKQSITLFLKDGTTYEWEFGLCPTEAYGKMLQDTTDTTSLDTSIHSFLENFNG